MTRFRFRPLLALLGVVAALAIVAVDADARPRSGIGSRGTRTYTAPAPTTTAPTPARPIERSMTQPTQPGGFAQRPAAQQPGGFFGRYGGVLGGLAAGFLGAGLLGMLFGGGFMSGLAGFASILGFVLQIGLIALVVVLAYRWWKGRSQPARPALASAPGTQFRDTGPNEPRQPTSFLSGSALGGLGLGNRPMGAPPMGAPAMGAPPVQQGPAEPSDEIGIKPDDYNAFERLLSEIQTAYAADDQKALGDRVTPEMLSYFAEDLADLTRRGLVNQVSDVKLLQGDLAEAWREGNTEYATVALRYSSIDRTIERATGKLVEGSTSPQETTQVWTFLRDRGGSWMLSAIQDA